MVRNKFLAVPSFVASRMPAAVRGLVFKLAEERIHEALDELASGGAEILASMKDALAENDPEAVDEAAA